MGLIWLINQIRKEFNNSISPNQNFTVNLILPSVSIIRLECMA